MIEDITTRNLSHATQQSYIYAVRKFSRHFGASPDRLGVEDVRAYQLHLIAKKRSWSHINQAACALRFFYGVTMGRQDAFERIVNGREPEKLPPVLAPDEIARFLEAVVGLRNRVALTTAYAAAVYATLEELFLGSVHPRGVGEFTLPGLLKVTLRKVPARRAGTLVRNPANGEMIKAAAKPAGIRVKVRALSKLKAAAAS